MRTLRDEEAWQESRRVVIARDAGLCRLCGQKANGSLGDVHHLVPRAAGGGDDPSNLVLLCDGCHASRHPRLAVGLARAALIRWGLMFARLIDREGLLRRDPRALRPILSALGVDELRAEQMEPILQALRGEDVLLVQPTGSGKSLCFQVPALANPGLTVVISPLRALMDDQVAGLLQRGVPATMIHSDVPQAEREARYELLQQEAFKLLYVAPERFTLTAPAERERLAALRPAFMVVDEAHCIDRWGPAFRPDYAELGAIRELLSHPPVLAFTATAGPASRRRIAESLGISASRALVRDADRPNLELCRVSVPQRQPGSSGPDRPLNQERIAGIARALAAADDGVNLIFVPTKKIGHALVDALTARGARPSFYHGDLPGAQKEELLQRTTGKLDPPIRTMIATSAFGMGVDIPNVRLVILWQQPPCVEDLLQQIGRAGRDGKRSVAVVLTDREQDLGLLRFLAERTVNQAAEARTGASVDSVGLLSAMARDADSLAAILQDPQQCVRRALLEATGAGERKRRSFAIRVVEFVLGLRRARVEPRQHCCDACDPVWASTILGIPSVGEVGRNVRRQTRATQSHRRQSSTEQPCPRCAGTGRIDRYRHIEGGKCFACNGTGRRAGARRSR